MFKLFLRLFLLILVFVPKCECALSFPSFFKENPTFQFPSIAKSRNGYSIVVWNQGNQEERAICAATKTADGILSSTLTLASGMPFCSYPTVFLDKTLTATIVWVTADPQGFLILQSVRLPHSQIPTEIMSHSLGVHGSDKLFIDVAGDDSGNLIAAWSAAHQTGVKALSLFSQADSWSPPKVLSSAASELITQAPAISLGDKQAAVVWKEKNERLRGALLTFSGNKWTSIEQPLLLPKNAQTITNWSAALDPKGNLNVVFAHKDNNGYQNVSFASLNKKDNQWSKSLPISESDVNARLPFIGIDKKGDAFVFWSEPNGDDYLKVTCAVINQDKLVSRSVQNLSYRHNIFFFDPLRIHFEKDGGIDIWGASLLNSPTEQGFIHLKATQ